MWKEIMKIIVDDSARINVPGVEKDENWSWKLVDFSNFKQRIKDF